MSTGDTKVVVYNPRRRAVVPRSEGRAAMKVQYLTETEYVALLEAASRIPEHVLLMRLLWETGVRISEALALTYADVYPDGINVMHGKGNKQRMIPCQAPILGELMRYGKDHQTERIFCRVTTEVGVLYFMRRYAAAIGLNKRLHPHLFRHSWAINVIRQTGNPFALQSMGGWSDMETIKIYMRLAQDGPHEAIAKMNFPQMPTPLS